MALQTQSIVGDGSNGHHRFTLYVTEEWYDIPTVQSYLTYRLVLSPLGNGWNWAEYYNGGVSCTVNVNGEKQTRLIPEYNGRDTVTVMSGETYVLHNPDGKKDISFSFSVDTYDVYYLPGDTQASGTMALTQIPRRATIVDAPNFTDEDNPVMTISNPAGNAVTKLEVGIYDADGYYPYAAYRELADKTATSYEFELTSEERSLIYEATKDRNSISAKFYIRTTIGEYVDTHYLERTITIVNADPVITENTVLATGRVDTIISGCNTIEITFVANAVKGASIKSKTITCGNKFTDTPLTEIGDNYYRLYNVESGDFIFTSTDSRGNSTSVTVPKYYIPYTKPTCNMDVDMDIVDGTVAQAKLTISGTAYGGYIDDGANPNKCSVAYRWKTSNGSYCDWITIADEETFYNYSFEIVIPDLNDSTTYTFQARIFDNVYVEPTAIESNEYQARAVPIFDWGDNDFNFNVPVTVNGSKIGGSGANRICRVITHNTVEYAANSYVKFNQDSTGHSLYNEDIATFENNGLITINKDMVALINVHVCCGYVPTSESPSADDVRSWIKLMNYATSWKYAESINYGNFTTGNISVVERFEAGTKIGVLTAHPIYMNTSGFTGSYLEIIEL